jgi:L-serine dehydratase
MVGASSSHVAAAARIGRIAACCLAQDTAQVQVEFCKNSSLAYTYHSHGSDMGFAAGLIGLPMDDARVSEAVRLANGSIALRFMITDTLADHPNNYLVRILRTDGSELTFQAISTGGGMIDLWEFCGVPLHFCGDYHAALLLCKLEEAYDVAQTATARMSCKATIHKNESALVELSSSLHPEAICAYPVLGLLFLHLLFLFFRKINTICYLRAVRRFMTVLPMAICAHFLTSLSSMKVLEVVSPAMQC